MVKVGDMFYAKAADATIQEKGECGGAVTAILTAALEQNLVDGALVIRRGESIYDGFPFFATTKEEILESAGSLHCAPTLSAKVIKNYLDAARDTRVAVTCKPCDGRAIVEMGKRNQINMDNVFMVGVNCAGTMPPIPARVMIEKFYEIDPDDVVKEEIAKGKLIIQTKDGEHKEVSIDTLEEEGYGRRKNCQRCEYNIPRMADVACGNWGVIGPEAGKATFVEVLTDKGQKLLDSASSSGAVTLTDAPPEGIALREKLDGIMVKMAHKFMDAQFAKFDGDNKFEKIFAELDKCILCRNCIINCPICYCEECFTKKDYVMPQGKLPPEPMFHLTRLMHIAPSCVDCGQCEDGCPAEIPISTITHMVQTDIQKAIGYVPGRSLEDAFPLSYWLEVQE